jgi:hypothetical protein
MERYDVTCDAIADRELFSLSHARAPKLFRRITRAVKPIPKVRGLWSRLALDGLYRLPGPDLPSVIEYRNDRWIMRR